MESNSKEKIIQDGGLVTPGIIYVTSADNSANVGVVSGATNIWLGGSTTKTIKQIATAANNYTEYIGNQLNNTAFVDANGNPIFDLSGNAIIDKPLLLSDLMKLLNPTSQIYAVFNAIPLAQFKHLPDPTALNPVSQAPAPAISGGQLDLSSNMTSVDVSNSKNSDFEEMPSLVVEDSPTGGSYKSNKWSSHKKRKSVRIRTKKNKKLN